MIFLAVHLAVSLVLSQIVSHLTNILLSYYYHIHTYIHTYIHTSYLTSVSNPLSVPWLVLAPFCARVFPCVAACNCRYGDGPDRGVHSITAFHLPFTRLHHVTAHPGRNLAEVRTTSFLSTLYIVLHPSIYLSVCVSVCLSIVKQTHTHTHTRTHSIHCFSSTSKYFVLLARPAAKASA